MTCDQVLSGLFGSSGFFAAFSCPHAGTDMTTGDMTDRWHVIDSMSKPSDPFIGALEQHATRHGCAA